MGTKHQRYRIDREFMRAIQATGAYQAFQDSELRGFGVKVTPGGTASYTWRWKKPDGTQGRKTTGYWPAMNPGDARDAARRESEVIDRKGDTLTITAVRQAKRTQLKKQTGADVLSFWRVQPFDLALDPQGDLGNCDCCFLKARHKIVRALVAEPWRADWWIEQESAEHGATFRNDRPPYRDLKREALFYARQIPFNFEDPDEGALVDCFCGD